MDQTKKPSVKSIDDSPQYPDPNNPRSFPIPGDLIGHVNPLPPGVRIKTRPYRSSTNAPKNNPK
jgi:hypothetical protein